MRLSQYPTDPLGTKPAPLPGQMRIRGYLPYSQNSAIAVFDTPPVADDVLGAKSATNVNLWSAVAVDPTIVGSQPFTQSGDVVPTRQTEVAFTEADRNRPEQIHVVFKGPLEPRVLIEVTASNQIAGADCEILSGELVQRFRAPTPGPPQTPRFLQEDKYRDLAFEYFPANRQQPTATYRYDSSGDIGVQGNEQSLLKRLYRRLETLPGGYSHLGTGYGLDSRSKKLARRGDLQALVNRVAEQARLEPEVREATATMQETRLANGALIARIKLSVLRVDGTAGTLILELPV